MARVQRCPVGKHWSLVVPVREADLATRAMSGWRRYGKGRHPAGLNFGDCFTYALAERTGHPVLCTGDAFAATDITVMRPGPAPDEAQATPERPKRMSAGCQPTAPGAGTPMGLG